MKTNKLQPNRFRKVTIPVSQRKRIKGGGDGDLIKELTKNDKNEIE